MSARPRVSCRVIAVASGDATYGLRFELRNRGEAPIEVSTYEPFTAFSVSATVDNKPVTVHQPALDIPVNPITIDLPPGITVTLVTPIRLRISEGADPGTNGFVWTIAHDMKKVSLHVSLRFPAPLGTTCQVVIEG